MLKSPYKTFILLVLCLLCFKKNIHSQHDIGKYEFRWAFWHPFAALKVKRHLPEAMNIYKAVKQAKVLDTLEFGGKLDAEVNGSWIDDIDGNRRIGVKLLDANGWFAE